MEFILNNWLSIVSIIIGATVSSVFYRLQKKDSISAAVERKRHAAKELLDVIESYIINKQKLSENVIENLIHASERDHSVSLRPACTVISLLQDVALRLQRSRHLDIPQKSEYSEKIEELINLIRTNYNATVFADFNSEIENEINEIECMVEVENRANIRKKITWLLLTERNLNNFETAKSRENSQFLALSTMLFGVAAAIASSLLGSRIFEKVSPSTLGLSEKLFPLLGAALGLLVVSQAIITILRIKRRTKRVGATEINEKS
jgi:hypothetical protein